MYLIVFVRLSNLNRLTYDLKIWGSAFAMSNNHHYQSKVMVCVSVFSGRLQIIVLMWLIGF